MRHRIDRTGGAVAGVFAGHWERVSDDGLDHPAIGGWSQSIANAEVHIEKGDLEVGHGEQCVPLLIQRFEVADLAKSA